MMQGLLIGGTSVEHLTFGTRLRLDSTPNVSCKSYTRIIVLLVFLMVLKFAPNLAAGGKQMSEPEH